MNRASAAGNAAGATTDGSRNVGSTGQGTAHQARTGERVRLRWLTAEEAERLLAACRVSKEADLTDVVEFTLFSGLRQGKATEQGPP